MHGTYESRRWRSQRRTRNCLSCGQPAAAAHVRARPFCDDCLDRSRRLEEWDELGTQD
jgi:hypothetical protein